MTPRATRLAVGVALALTVFACAPAGPTPSATRAPAGVATPTPTGDDPSDEPEPSEPPEGSGGTVAVDPSLLAILPARLEEVEVEPDLETAAEVASDPALQGVVAAMAAAIAVGSSDVEDPDYAVASVVRLLPGIFTQAFHRDWRDSFDAVVCDQAGGIEGHAQADIAGHDTFITTCTGGVRTYHVHSTDAAGDDLLISIQAFGERRFGELMVTGLTE